MKQLFAVVFFLFAGIMTRAQDTWHPAGDKIKTAWADKVDPASPLPDYPRPQMVRSQWQNLNGSWDYAIVNKDLQAAFPASADGKILVPYAVESSLSGVGKRVGKDKVLWYRKQLTLPKLKKDETVLLHFGAVDWKCTVYVNGRQAGEHEGGYDPFSFDITSLLKKKGTQEITVCVWDPSDEGPQPRGKQVVNPNGIWYTPVTGIWQTVWTETVPRTYISETRQTPDIDKENVSVKVAVKEAQPGDEVLVTAWKGEEKLAEATIEPNGTAVLPVKNMQLWSPENPFLYKLTATINRKGKKLDAIDSYFAMRKISIGKDANGVQRMLLNNRFVFQYGPLDQGWWPDGLYTAPTDEALKYDIVKTKDMGFNMIRKHVKVEPARWYYHCDQLGMLVWQDMPSGDHGTRWETRPGVEGIGHDMNRSAESEAIYRKEWAAIVNSLYNFPSIVVWVPFNEAWGQFKTVEITEWTIQMDPSRLINPASGGNFHLTGHIVDLHNYPLPAMPKAALFGDKYSIVLGEFGGLGLPIEGHTWQAKDNWGYRNYKDRDELFKNYSDLVDRLPDLIKRGLSAAVYTQTTDVEVEVNGLMTYDRKLMKIPAEKLKALHQQLYSPSLVAKD